MNIFFRNKKEERRKKIIKELYELRNKYPNCRSFISDMILYAEIGKNRMNLSDDWVLETEKFCKEWTNR